MVLYDRRLGVLVFVVLLLGACGRERSTEEVRTDPPMAATQPAGGAVGELSWEMLAGASYTGIVDEGQTVRLSDGRWEGEPYAEGAASRPSLELLRGPFARADLDADGEDEAAVLLDYRGGGTGRFTHLAVMELRDGRPDTVAVRRLGDRLQVLSLDADDGRLLVDVVAPGPDDAACCPTRRERRSYSLEAGALEEEIEVTGKLSLDDLGGSEWRLVAWNWDQAHEAEPVPTLGYQDGKLSGFAGCNRYFGSVESERPGAMKVGPLAGTRMACPEPAMAVEDRFMQALGSAVSYGFEAGRLVLGYADGVLIFERGEPIAD